MKKAIRTKDGFRVTHLNRRRACRLMCIECMGWDDIGNQVDECNAVCPIVCFKCMSGKQHAAQRDRAIKNFCIECMGGQIYSVSGCTAVYCPIYPYRNSLTDKSVLFDDNTSDDIVLEMTEKARRDKVRLCL